MNSEAKQSRVIKPPSRAKIKEALRDLPIDRLIGASRGELTHKQKEFARHIAMGNTGADAYRSSYDTSGTPTTVGNEASRLKADPRITAEIEAYSLAIEAAKYRTPIHLRELVIQSLVQVIVDPESRPAQRIQAAKVLGTVTEVAAFTERREVTTINSSDSIREKIISDLNTIYNGDIDDVTAKDSDSLLNELLGEPTVPPAPESDASVTLPPVHINTHEQSIPETIEETPPSSSSE